MALFAIADLHLSHARPKPMDVFGDHWAGHPQNVADNWRRVVGEGDTVLVAGDISWAMKFADAQPDLAWIHALPGRKVLIRGNHDYWWDRISRMRAEVPPSISLLQHDCITVDGWNICGTRGWDLPGYGWSENPADDEKVFHRERDRLRASLQSAPDGPIVAMIHYPPFYDLDGHAGFHDVFREFGVRAVVFGHLHGPDGARAFQGERDGVRYVFCACDGVDFTPVRVKI